MDNHVSLPPKHPTLMRKTTLEPLDATLLFLADSTVHCELCVLSWMDFVQEWWWINWLGARALSDLGIPLCSAQVLKGLFYSAAVYSANFAMQSVECLRVTSMCALLQCNVKKSLVQ